MTPKQLLQNRTPALYASVNELIVEIAKQLIYRLEWMTLQPKKIVEMGFGLAECSALLAERFPDAKMCVVNPFADFLEQAKQQSTAHAEWLCAATDALPFETHSIDLIIANLVLPWEQDVEKVFHEWQRVLRPGGLLMFTALGPDSMRELPVKPLAFPHCVDMHNLGDAIATYGFQDPVLDIEQFELAYRDPAKLFLELKAMGMIQGQTQALQLIPNEEQKFPVTFEVIYGHAWASALVGCRPDDTGTIRVPLSRIVKR